MRNGCTPGVVDAAHELVARQGHERVALDGLAVRFEAAVPQRGKSEQLLVGEFDYVDIGFVFKNTSTFKAQAQRHGQPGADDGSRQGSRFCGAGLRRPNDRAHS
jgi:hypothetical protein